MECGNSLEEGCHAHPKLSLYPWDAVSAALCVASRPACVQVQFNKLVQISNAQRRALWGTFSFTDGIGTFQQKNNWPARFFGSRWLASSSKGTESLCQSY